MSVDIPDDGRFCVGPSTGFIWWYARRDELEVNKGPWESTLDLLTAVGQRELQWLQKFGKPRYPRELIYRELYGNKEVEPTEQLGNLQNYLKIAPYLVSPREEWNTPMIRHPDLSPTDIFVDESNAITGIIDWERTVILPMLLHARVPPHFQNFGYEASDKFRFPALPDNFDELLDPEKEQEMERYRRRQLHYYYLGYTNRVNNGVFRAIGTPSARARNQIYDAANQPWEGDNTSLKAQLIIISFLWPELGKCHDAPDEFPLVYTEDEVKTCLHIDAE